MPCRPGSWGVDCAETCGNCAECANCDATTGECPHGCDTGFTLPFCTEMCPNMLYGSSCDQKCGHCANKTTCNHDGLCLDGCDGDYIPPMCVERTCPQGVWGSLCSNVCGKCQGGATCRLIDGACPGPCEEGYGGSFCKKRVKGIIHRDRSQRLQQCKRGTWGDECGQTCSGNCADDATCDPTDGSCIHCAPGYKLPDCSDRCEPGTWGSNCRFPCGECARDETCEDVSGKCPNECKEGFHPPACITSCDDGWYGDNCEHQCGHCRGGCHYKDGFCINGCETDWEGDTCSAMLRLGSGHRPRPSGTLITLAANTVMIVSTIFISL